MRNQPKIVVIVDNKGMVTEVFVPGKFDVIIVDEGGAYDAYVKDLKEMDPALKEALHEELVR